LSAPEADDKKVKVDALFRDVPLKAEAAVPA
jgi:hypothetical protein